MTNYYYKLSLISQQKVKAIVDQNWDNFDSLMDLEMFMDNFIINSNLDTLTTNGNVKFIHDINQVGDTTEYDITLDDDTENHIIVRVDTADFTTAYELRNYLYNDYGIDTEDYNLDWNEYITDIYDESEN